MLGQGLRQASLGPLRQKFGRLLAESQKKVRWIDC